jgi:hypothetical protein
MPKTRSRARTAGWSGHSTQRVELAIHPHRAWWVQLLLIVWRWAFELAAALTLVLAYTRLTDRMSAWAALAVLLAPVALTLAVPWSRRQLVGWSWCTVTRHRLRALFVAVNVTNGHGKLPWLLLVRPTPVGERALCLMVAGLSVDDLSQRTESIAATCWARESRVARSARCAPLVWIDVVRRDPLAVKTPLRSVLMTVAARIGRLHPDPTAPAPATAPPAPLVEHFGPPTPADVPVPRTPTTSDGPTVVRHGEDLSDYV